MAGLIFAAAGAALFDDLHGLAALPRTCCPTPGVQNDVDGKFRAAGHAGSGNTRPIWPGAPFRFGLICCGMAGFMRRDGVTDALKLPVGCLAEVSKLLFAGEPLGKFHLLIDLVAPGRLKSMPHITDRFQNLFKFRIPVLSPVISEI
jgi:hypothetical protein